MMPGQNQWYLLHWSMLAVCCCCCLCSIFRGNGRYTMDKKSFALVLFVVCLMLLGALIWYIPYLEYQRDQNAIAIPNQMACSQICGSSYVDGSAINTCCWDLISACYTKEECKDNNQNFYDFNITINYVLLGFSSVYSTIYLIFLLVMGVKKCKERNQYIQQPLLIHNDDLAVNPINSNSEAINRLAESFHYRDSKSVCSICLEEFNDQKSIRLDCSHVFHSDCIKDWIKIHNTCPLCRDTI